MSSKSIMRCQGGQPQGVKGQIAVAPTFLDAQFHRAQARLKSNTLRALFRGQSEFAPAFYRAATGDAGFYEIPAYLRKRIHTHDFDNRCRVAQYADRVRAHIQEMAA